MAGLRAGVRARARAVRARNRGTGQRESEDPPTEVRPEVSASNPEPSSGEPDPGAPSNDEAPASDTGSEEPPAQRPPRRGDTEERIRVAAADAADAAEQRSIEEILALEEDLERAKVEAASKLEELEGRLTGMEDRAAGAEREAQEAR